MKTLSSFLLYTINPFCGFIIITLFLSGYWWLTPFVVIVGYFNLKFYFKMHPEQIEEHKKFLSEHTYIGEGYMCSIYRNNKTGEYIEI